MKRLAEIRRIARAREASSTGLDPRAAILATLLYLICIISLGKYELAGGLAFLAFPLFALLAMDIPARPILGKLIFVSPFVLMIGLANPWLDTRPMLRVHSLTLSAGSISFLVIACKSTLSVTAVAILLELFPFQEICAGLRSLRLPEPFVTQILFAHRYLFLLVEEGQSLQKARDLKSFGRKGRDIRTTAALLGCLFIRTLDRSQRIHRSMLSRGFDGTFRLPAARTFTRRDGAFLFLSALLLAGFRAYFHFHASPSLP
ncbi:MAG: energy-coupling factor transporter transmembrane component T [Fibrobacteria bacterium]